MGKLLGLVALAPHFSKLRFPRFHLALGSSRIAYGICEGFQTLNQIREIPDNLSKCPDFFQIDPLDSAFLEFSFL